MLMPEPLILSIGAFILGLMKDSVLDAPKSAASDYIKAKVKERLTLVFLDPIKCDDIQRALREAWALTIEQAIESYENAAKAKPLALYQWKAEKTNALTLSSRETLDELFPPLTSSGALLNEQEVAGFFGETRDAAEGRLLERVEGLPAWAKLPADFQELIRRRLLDGIVFNFIEVAVKREPKARDALFFKQLIEVQRSARLADAQLESLRGEVLAGLQRGAEYGRWAREVLGTLSAAAARAEAKLDDVIKLLEEGGRVEKGAPPIPTRHRSNFDKILLEHQWFGGRREQRARIEEFLAGPGDYMFVEGNSGYGKTALLAHLVNGDREGFQYHFFSRRYGFTGERQFQENIAQQLLACHGVGGRLPHSDSELRALCIQLIQTPAPEGRPVRLLIDALDEADDGFSLRPYFVRPGAGVHIIFSARPVADRDWLNELGLSARAVRRLSLERMEREDVRSMLREAGPATAPLADDERVLSELEVVTRGDPFFLRTLVDEFLEDFTKARQELLKLTHAIESERPQPPSIQHAGLQRYLRQWWEEVVEKVGQSPVDDLLGYLAVSRGPLLRDELIEVSTDDALRGLNIDQTLKAVGRFVIGDEADGYTMCHPRFRDYVADRMKDEISRYRQALLNYCAGWAQNGSRYAVRYYARHLADAGAWDGLHQLLTSGFEHQPFAEAHFAAGGSYAGYIDDVELAWAHADRAGRENPTAVGRQARYVLIVSSLHSLAENISPPLLRAVVGHGLWKPEIALQHARSIPVPSRRAEALIDLAPLLPEPERTQVWHEALAATQSDAGESYGLPEWWKVADLESVTARLPAHLLPAALKAARSLSDDFARAFALSLISSHLPPELKAQALREAAEAALELAAAPAGGATHPQAERLNSLRRAFESALSGVLDPERAGALDDITADIRDSLGRLALLPIYEVGIDQTGAMILAQLAGFLLPATLLEILSVAARPFPSPGSQTDEDSEHVAKTHFESSREHALVAIIPHLPDEALDKALDAVRSLEQYFRGRPMNVLVHRLPEGRRTRELLLEALECARANYYSARLLGGLVQYLPEPERSSALHDSLKKLREDVANAYIFSVTELASVVADLPPTEQTEALLREVLEAARRVDEDRDRVEALAIITPRLPAALLEEALKVARAIVDERWQIEALTTLVSVLPDTEWRREVLRLAVQAVQRIDSSIAQDMVLGDLTPLLPPPLALEALEIAVRMREFNYRISSVARLIPKLPEREQTQILDRLLELSRSPEWEGYIDTPRLVTALLEMGQPLRALELARAIKYTRWRAGALAEVAAALEEPARTEVFRTALQDLKAVEDGREIIDVLSKVASHLPEAVWDESVATIFLAGGRRATTFRALIPLCKRMAESGFAERALSTARKASYSYDRALVMAELLPLLADGERGPALQDALNAARKIGDPDYRAQALLKIIPYLPAADRMPVIDEVLRMAEMIERGWSREFRLSEAFILLAELGQVDEALERALGLKEKWARVKALCQLAPLLPEHQRPEVLREALQVTWRIENAHGDRDVILAELVEPLLGLPRDDRYSLWQETLRALTARNRRNLLVDLKTLAPVITSLGNAEAVGETADAITSVCRWWP
jgi:hypothetical protein